MDGKTWPNEKWIVSRIAPDEWEEERTEESPQVFTAEEVGLVWDHTPNGEDANAYQSASAKVKVLVEYEYQRLIALELHSRFGNSILQDRAAGEEARTNMLRQMLDERNKDIFNLHAERKTEQMKTGAKLKVVEEQLRELTSKNRNLHKHCEQLQNTT
mmetsp:Transcript_843/g.3308  ORF Transcript_843/g.3308 Transcript_843/m.3308 type:complete len:158 (+) Transcript_843:159-632(+)